MSNKFTVKFNEKEYPCLYITDKATALKVLSKLCKETTVIAGDTETYGDPDWITMYPKAALDPYLGHIRLFQIFTGKGCAIFDLMKIGDVDLKPLFKTRPVVFHNASFDLKMLKYHYGIEEFSVHCTLLMYRLLTHAVSPVDIKGTLGEVVKSVLGVQINKSAGVSDWAVPELTHEQLYYAAQDTIVLYDVYQNLKEKLKALKLERVYNIQRAAQYVVCDIELRGMRIDKTLHDKNIIKWRLENEDAEEEVKRITGLSSITPIKIANWLVENLDPETLENWPRTEKGNIKTDAGTLLEYSELALVKPFSVYQKTKTLCTSFGTKLYSYINPVTGRIHPSYNVGLARTGRLSCSQPNFQNQPHSEEMRSVYTAKEGCVLIDIDYASIEPRIITELSQEPELLKVYTEGSDLYKTVASKILNRPVDSITKDERQYGKVCVLSLNYLGGIKTFMAQASKIGVSLTEEEGWGFINKYRESFPVLRKWQLEQVRLTEQRNYTVASKTGKLCRYTKDTYYNASANFPVQALAAECMQVALKRVSHAIKPYPAYIIANVHDEVVIECEMSCVESCAKVAEEAMTKAYTDLMGDCITAKGIATATWGDSWASAKG